MRLVRLCPGNLSYTSVTFYAANLSVPDSVLFSEQILINCGKIVPPHYKRVMEPLTVLGIFLLGASAGSLITMIRYRHELGCLRAQFDQIQKEENQKDKEAA